MIDQNVLVYIIAFLFGFLFAKHFSNIELFESTNVEFDKLNKAGCCVSNTAGYTIQPVAISPLAPGFANKGAYKNPCMPMK